MSAERLRAMLSEASPAPWPKTPFELVAHLSGRDAPLVARAPDAIALLADIGDQLSVMAAEEGSPWFDIYARLDALCGDE